MSRTDILKRAWTADPENMGLFEQLKMAIVREKRDDLPIFFLKRDKFHAVQKVILDESFLSEADGRSFRAKIVKNYYGEYFVFITNHKELKWARGPYYRYKEEKLVFGDYTLYRAFDSIWPSAGRNYLYKSDANVNIIREIRRLFKSDGFNVPTNRIMINEVNVFQDSWAIKRNSGTRFRYFGYGPLRNPDLTWRDTVAQTYCAYGSSLLYYVLRALDDMQWDKFGSNFDLSEFEIAGKIHPDAGRAIEEYVPPPEPTFDYGDDEDWDDEEYGDGP